VNHRPPLKSVAAWGGLAGAFTLACFAGGCFTDASAPATPAAVWGAPGAAPALRGLALARQPDADAAPPAVGAAAGGPGDAAAGGQPATDVVLADLAGPPVRLGDLRGRPAVVNFFASWCGPCAEEVPALVAARDRHRDDGLQLVLVDAVEDRQTAQDFADRLGLRDVRVLLDESGAEAGPAYRVSALAAGGRPG